MRKFMKALLASAAIGVASLSASQPANAGALTQWDRVGNWQINYSAEANACSMFQEYDRGTRLVVAFMPEVSSWVLMIGNRSWSDTIGKGTQHRIVMRLDGYDGWEGVLTGMFSSDDVPFMFTKVKPEFVLSVMRRYKVEIFDRDGRKLTGLPLVDSYAAMLSVIACQKAH